MSYVTLVLAKFVADCVRRVELRKAGTRTGVEARPEVVEATTNCAKDQARLGLFEPERLIYGTPSLPDADQQESRDQREAA